MSFHPNEIARRGRFATMALIAAYLALVGRFFSVQVLQHASYVLQSDQNRLNQIPLPAPRGIVYDRNGEVIAENVAGYTISILAPRRDSLRATLARLARHIPMSQQQIATVMRRREQAPNSPAVVFADAPFEIVSALEEHRVEFPGLIIQTAPKRHYPDSTTVSAFIGYIAEISESELADTMWTGYTAGQQIGKAGLELQYESALRGVDGSRFVEVDAHGRVVRDAGVRAELAPVPGPPLRTNLDMSLQRFVAQQFDTLIGAAVVLEPRTGAVLALHSAPGYDPNRFIGGVSTSYYSSLRDDPRLPLYNKAIQGYYPPGSTWKLATVIMALEQGLVTLDELMPQPCTGGYVYGNRRFRCWERAGHGRLALVRALELSCDVYFYQLGLKLKLSNLVAGGRRMLFADRTGIDLPNEMASDFPAADYQKYYADRFKRDWAPTEGRSNAEALNMAIGQGSNSQTVVNMARFYTALATGGEAARPMVVGRAPERTRIFRISDEQMDSLRHAMEGVVSARGTAASAALKGFAGKTGTAQNAQDPDADHAWFVGFAPADDPKVVVAVMIEFGEHGYLAARIAKAITERYLKVSLGDPSVTGD